MWDIYTDTGIVIKTKFDELCSSIEGIDMSSAASSDDKIPSNVIGEVQYIDYEKDEIPNSLVHPYFYKRESFKNEQEIRIAHFDMEGFDDTGEYVSVDVDQLIEEIRVAPHAKDWYFDLVNSITMEFEFDFPVNRSSLEKEPLY